MKDKGAGKTRVGWANCKGAKRVCVLGVILLVLGYFDWRYRIIGAIQEKHTNLIRYLNEETPKILYSSEMWRWILFCSCNKVIS